MAVECGGNCEVSVRGETVVKHDVKISGEPNLPSLVATNSSEVYSKNIMALLDHISKEGSVELNLEDEIVKGSLIVYNGEVVNEKVKERLQA
jgi:NAD(P) transhydrogenase subunit alpha